MAKTRAEYMREWRARHPENADYQREYNKRYLLDPGKLEAARVRARQWYWDNRERKLATEKRRQEAKRVGRRKGQRHHEWKGDEAGYNALHSWLRREYGSPTVCELCGSATVKRLEWANRDHKYRRAREDWIQVCTACHRRYDYEHGLSKKGGRRRTN